VNPTTIDYFIFYFNFFLYLSFSEIKEMERILNGEDPNLNPPNCCQKQEDGRAIYAIPQPIIQFIDLKKCLFHKPNRLPKALHKLTIS
jgi:hypothetical protein